MHPLATRKHSAAHLNKSFLLTMRLAFDDSFLRSLSDETHERIISKLRDWDLTSADFMPTFEAWFDNFKREEKETALRIFFNISYYSYKKYQDTLLLRHRAVKRILAERNITDADDLFVVTAEGQGDSSHAHAYHVSKAWNIPREFILSLAGC